jgi:peptidoglycan/xylan/chitin deacetylase (PgdA/CDA1 family)
MTIVRSRTRGKARVVATWLGLGLVALALLAFGQFKLSNSRSFQICGGLTNRVDTQAKVVALTFDDGPHPGGTQQIVRTLAAKQVRATFYLTGSELERYPQLGREIAAAGHEIGNHSYAHERMLFVTPGRVADEVRRTDALIRQTGYRGEITFRPPYGKKLIALPCYLRMHDRTTITWDVEPNSYPDVDADASRIVKYSVEHTRPGSIILLHGMYPSRHETRKAIGPLIDALRERGYRFVTVSELLELRSAQADAT